MGDVRVYIHFFPVWRGCDNKDVQFQAVSMPPFLACKLLYIKIRPYAAGKVKTIKTQYEPNSARPGYRRLISDLSNGIREETEQ